MTRPELSAWRRDARRCLLAALLPVWFLSGPLFPQPAAADAPARHRFEGRLVLHGEATTGGFREYTDDYAVTGDDDSPHKHLPEFDFELLQVGDALVPTRRGPIPGAHTYWEYVLEPGRVWQQAGDSGLSRAALPFSLVEANANCTHNGVLQFLYKASGQVSTVTYQVNSETCAYFKADLWGVLDATYTPYRLPDRKVLARDFRHEQQSRLPRKPFVDLARDYPGVDPQAFAHRDDVDPAHLTTWGVVVDGVHYAGGCPTRAGDYPFCEVLDLPSYSVAKSVFAGLALMRLEKLYPGARQQIVADYVPECVASGNWADVTFEQLLDMASGNFLSATDHADEEAAHSDADFFTRETHRERIDYACNRFPRKAVPGSTWVYRTSDTHLLGAALNAFLKGQRGASADLYTDLVVADIWRPLALSPTAGVSRRTRDAVAQPFTGYGLTLLADDVAKLANFLNAAAAHSGAQPEQLLDRRLYRGALQLDAGDPGVSAAADGSMRYNNGFWAVRLDDLPGCDGPQFVPFMSGYGGISVALLPNGVSYYYFSDNQDFRFRRAVVEAGKIRPYCQPGAREPTEQQGKSR